jgi:hypothetical protein
MVAANIAQDVATICQQRFHFVRFQVTPLPTKSVFLPPSLQGYRMWQAPPQSFGQLPQQVEGARYLTQLEINNISPSAQLCWGRCPKGGGGILATCDRQPRSPPIQNLLHILHTTLAKTAIVFFENAAAFQQFVLHQIDDVGGNTFAAFADE